MRRKRDDRAAIVLLIGIASLVLVMGFSFSKNLIMEQMKVDTVTEATSDSGVTVAQNIMKDFRVTTQALDMDDSNVITNPLAGDLRIYQTGGRMFVRDSSGNDSPVGEGVTPGGSAGALQFNNGSSGVDGNDSYRVTGGNMIVAQLDIDALTSAQNPAAGDLRLWQNAGRAFLRDSAGNDSPVGEGVTPGGSAGALQFNNGATLDGNDSMLFDGTDFFAPSLLMTSAAGRSDTIVQISNGAGVSAPLLTITGSSGFFGVDAAGNIVASSDVVNISGKLLIDTSNNIKVYGTVSGVTSLSLATSLSTPILSVTNYGLFGDNDELRFGFGSGGDAAMYFDGATMQIDLDVNAAGHTSQVNGLINFQDNVTTGGTVVSTGAITASTGNITATVGNVVAGGTVTSGTTLTAGGSFVLTPRPTDVTITSSGTVPVVFYGFTPLATYGGAASDSVETLTTTGVVSGQMLGFYLSDTTATVTWKVGSTMVTQTDTDLVQTGHMVAWWRYIAGWNRWLLLNP